MKIITQESIDEVRKANPIEVVVGETVELTERGRAIAGPCPFHPQVEVYQPTLRINSERGFYHCSNCGAVGDVFRFVMETRELSFIESIKWLAERGGVELLWKEAPEEDLMKTHELSEKALLELIAALGRTRGELCAALVNAKGDTRDKIQTSLAQVAALIDLTEGWL